MLFGPIRLFLFLALIYWMDQCVFRKPNSKQCKSIPRVTMYFSLFILLGFFLIQLNFYDLLVIFLLILGLFFLRLWPFDLSKNLADQFKVNYKNTVLYIVKTSENILHSFLNPSTLKKSTVFSKTDFNQFFSYLFVISAAVTSHSYFFRFKSPNLSENWYKTLNAIKEVSSQKWFFLENSMAGDLLLINFYSKLTNISDAIALASFGLIEAIAMGVVLFWVVFKITSKNYFASFSAALTMGYLFTVLPLNLNEVAQHKSVFLALIIALPVMLICLKPTILRVERASYFKWMICFFTAIFFLNLYVAIFILPLFLIVASVLGINKNRAFVKRFLLAYILVLSLLFSLYYTVAQMRGIDLFVFINSNIYSFSSYTLTPHLVLPFQNLVHYYQILSIIVLVIVLFKYRKNPKSWFAALGFMIFVCILFHIYHFDNLKIDMDLLNQVTTVFIPLFFGIFLFVIFDTFTSVFKSQLRQFFLQWAASVSLIIGVFFLLKGNTLLQTPQREYFVKEEVMMAYDKIDRTFMPGTFAVVNTVPKHSIAKNDSNLINYDYFISNYLEQDKVFHKNIDNPIFLKENPEFNLPNSTIVFVYSKNAQFITSEIQEIDKQPMAQKTLEELNKRGRTIHLIMEKNLVKVYEIVNKHGQSKISDLLF